MSSAIGFGGTIPWQCLNCGNVGLIDVENLEGYQKAFITIKSINDILDKAFRQHKLMAIETNSEVIIGTIDMLDENKVTLSNYKIKEKTQDKWEQYNTGDILIKNIIDAREI